MKQTFNIILISDDNDNDLSLLLSIEKDLSYQLWSHVYTPTNDRDVMDECDLIVIGNIEDKFRLGLLLSRLYKSIPTIPIDKIMKLKPIFVAIYLNGYISTNETIIRPYGCETEIDDPEIATCHASIWHTGSQQRIMFTTSDTTISGSLQYEITYNSGVERPK